MSIYVYEMNYVFVKRGAYYLNCKNDLMGRDETIYEFIIVRIGEGDDCELLLPVDTQDLI